MTKIEKYGIYCRSWEGGWSNHPNDSGGATMKGVTYTTFCNYRKAKGLPKPSLDDLKNITNTEWNNVLRWGYWGKIKCDEIKDEWVTYLLADCVWMSGVGYIKRVQSLLGLKADGIIGPKSIEKINSMDGKKLFEMLWEQRKKFFQSIGTGKNSVFLKGWMRRLESIKYGSLIMSNGKKVV